MSCGSFLDWAGKKRNWHILDSKAMARPRPNSRELLCGLERRSLFQSVCIFHSPLPSDSDQSFCESSIFMLLFTYQAHTCSEQHHLLLNCLYYPGLGSFSICPLKVFNDTVRDNETVYDGWFNSNSKEFRPGNMIYMIVALVGIIVSNACLGKSNSKYIHSNKRSLITGVKVWARTFLDLNTCWPRE